MPGGYLGLDVSQHSDPLSDEQLRDLRAEGARFLVAGLQSEERFIQHIRSGGAAGMRAEAYIYLYDRHPANPSVTATDQVRWSMAKLQEHGLRVGRLWLDVEEGFEHGSTQENGDRLQACVDLARALSPEMPLGVYTRRSYWQTFLGNTARFAALPLWDAQWNTDADGIFHPDWPVDFSRFVSYGGWQSAHTRQYQGTNSWCGVNCDRNYREVTEPEAGQAGGGGLEADPEWLVRVKAQGAAAFLAGEYETVRRLLETHGLR